jgi:pullulanase
MSLIHQPRGRSAFAITALLVAAFFGAGGCNDGDRSGSQTAESAQPVAAAQVAAQAAEICNATDLSTVLVPVPPSDGGGGSDPVDVKVHYNRPDGNYTGWGLHLWQVDAGGAYLADYPGVTWPAPLAPAGFDSYGAYFLIEASKFTNAAAQGLGFIVHRGDDKDPDGDRLWPFSQGGELWLKSGDATIYRANPISDTIALHTVRVHYKRFDAGYQHWGLHLWNGSGIDVSRLPAGYPIEQWGNAVPLSAMPNYVAAADGSEVAFDLPVLNPADDASRTAVEFIIHGLPTNPNGGENNKDGWTNNVRITYSALSITADTGSIWLVQEDPTVHTAPADTSLVSTTDARAIWLDRALVRWPKVDSSGAFKLYHSADGRIVARRGEAVTGADGALALTVETAALPPALAERFKWVGAGVTLRVAAADSARLATLLRGQLVLVQEDAEGHVQGATTAQLAGQLDDRYQAAGQVSDLGVTFGRGRTTFKVWAPTAKQVRLCVYAGDSVRLEPMTSSGLSGVWTASLRGEAAGRYYRYAVDVFVRGTGVVRNLVTDPYSISLDANSQRSYAAELSASNLQPPGWRHHRRPRTLRAQEDMSIYELHVRDFSLEDRTVRQSLRGKYLAFTEERSAGMRHLRELARAGLTDIHLLPVFDIATVPELGCVSPLIPNAGPDSPEQQAAIEPVRDADCFNWGYDPLHYTAPEGSLASNPNDGAARVREFRAMVQALHEAGLRVGMDVVYNHTSASGQADKSVLDRVVPGYYHRYNAAGEVEKSTCCDNTATENLMMGKLMIDSVKVWATEYGIDSFRFDLMGHQPRDVMERLRAEVNAAAGRKVELVGEGWNFGEVANGARFVQASQLSLNGSGIATFSDRARDSVRGGGPFDGGLSLVQNQGYTNGLFYDDNGSGGGKTRDDLMAAADMIRSGLAGSIRSYPLTTRTDATIPLEQLDYNGQPAGYVIDPEEVVNYVENHDNQTLFDNNAYKLPLSTTREDRARVQMLAAAINSFSQGVAYFHAGIDTLRSKSMDRNSYNSGDWFNRLDWSYTDNNFGVGLPPAGDNADNWSVIGPRLANPAIKPTVSEIKWTRDAFRDLLAIRASTELFRLRTADDIKERLHFYNTGSAQNPAVLVGHLDGEGYRGCEFDDVLYFVNVDKVAHTLTIDAEKRKRYQLHPVHRAPDAADRRPRSATYDPATGAFSIPPRTAVVFVTR